MYTVHKTRNNQGDPEWHQRWNESRCFGLVGGQSQHVLSNVRRLKESLKDNITVMSITEWFN